MCLYCRLRKQSHLSFLAKVRTFSVDKKEAFYVVWLNFHFIAVAQTGSQYFELSTPSRMSTECARKLLEPSFLWNATENLGGKVFEVIRQGARDETICSFGALNEAADVLGGGKRSM